MTHKFNAYKRTSFNYAEGWKHLDDSELVGRFHELSASARDYGPDDGNSWYGECWDRYFRVKAPLGASFDDINAALRDAHSHSCRCEHDCCGHVSARVRSVKRIRRREYRVIVGYSTNC